MIIKRSELIKILAEQITQYGDGDVYLGDYENGYGEYPSKQIDEIFTDDNDDTILK
jgi:hypothetical protein